MYYILEVGNTIVNLVCTKMYEAVYLKYQHQSEP